MAKRAGEDLAQAMQDVTPATKVARTTTDSDAGAAATTTAGPKDGAAAMLEASQAAGRTTKHADTAMNSALFKQYQGHIDKRNDKHERLVKLSRSVTIGSKRAIFLLHRVTGTNAIQRQAILDEAQAKLDEVRSLLKSVALEVGDGSYYKHIRAFSPGMQEYIEAETFLVYLRDKSLATKQYLEDQLSFPVPAAAAPEASAPSTSTPTPEATGSTDLASEATTTTTAAAPAVVATTVSLAITDGDYLLGIADLTGELMRHGINSLGRGGDLTLPRSILTFMRDIHAGMNGVNDKAVKELGKKMKVMQQSIKKIEATCYNIQVRGAELPPDRLLSIGAGGGGGGGRDDDE